MESYEIEMMLRDDRPVTTSLDIAEKFGKKHFHVLEAIRNIESPENEPLWGESNFRCTNYKDSQCKYRPMYHITQEGFSVLAMGFTGKKALEWKIKYFRTFKNLAEFVLNKANVDWQKARKTGKMDFHNKTDTIKDFTAYAESQGSQSANRYYVAIGKMQKKSLGLVKEAYSKDPKFRDVLSTIELTHAMVGDKICKNAIIKGMNQELPYKEIYKLAKSKLEELGELLGHVELTHKIENRRI